MDKKQLERINAHGAKKRQEEKSARARAGFARWGNKHAVEPRGQIAVSRSLVDEFFQVYPPELRRAGADYGIRKAIDDAEAVKAFHAQFRLGPQIQEGK